MLGWKQMTVSTDVGANNRGAAYVDLWKGGEVRVRRRRVFGVLDVMIGARGQELAFAEHWRGSWY